MGYENQHRAVDKPEHGLAVRLDEIDLTILQALCDEAMASDSDIAKVVGVDSDTVHDRIDGMRSAGVLSVNVWLDFHGADSGIEATLLIKTKPGRSGELASALLELEAVDSTLTLIGTYDLIACLFCRDIAHLAEVVSATIEPMDGIVEVSTHIAIENTGPPGLRTHVVSQSRVRDRHS